MGGSRSANLYHGQPPLFDDFLGSSVDNSKWNVYNRDGDRINGDPNVVRPGNVTVSGGNLNILSSFSSGAYVGHTSEDPTNDITRDYACAQLASRQSWLYGTFDARVMTAGGVGTGPLFWMLGDGWKATQPFTANTPEANWPSNTGGWWEIDIMEFSGGSRTVNNCAAHCNTSDVLGVTLPFDANTRFMVYRLDWRPGWLRWYVNAEDGNGFVLLREITDTAKIPTNPGYVQCHVELGSFYGAVSSGNYPLTTQYDYVRVAP
jgi:beta-glucanase (GH16 family)